MPGPGGCAASSSHGLHVEDGVHYARKLTFRLDFTGAWGLFVGEHRSAVGGVTEGERRPVAIVGASGRFPGAKDLETFWANLSQGIDSVTEVPRERWTWGAPPFAASSARAGFLDEVDRFDPGFFGISREDAAVMDPQQRLVLMHCWKALEDAGHSVPVLEGGGKAGLFVGMRPSDYLPGLHERGLVENAQHLLGNDPLMVLPRVSRMLGVQGASLVVDAACASSLVAIHLACQQLQSGSVELALAGGVFVMATARFHRLAAEVGLLSPGGRCRPFSLDADGFVPAEGVGVVVLKLLERAVADGDRILGVIRGSGTVQSGRLPGAPVTNALGAGWADFIRDVQQQADVEPETISYVEAHGSGIRGEDDQELEALRAVFHERAPRAGFRAIGSVKGNVGHAVPAAGMAGLLKVLLAFEHQQLPPSLHADEAGDHERFTTTPFEVNTRSRPWVSEEGAPRRAAINAFGMGGTDCHLIVEEAPPLPPRVDAPERPAYLFFLSARSDEALRQFAMDLAERLGQALARGDAPHPGDVAFTLARGRGSLERRAAFVASDLQELCELLRRFDGSSGMREGGPFSAASRRALREMSGRMLRELGPERSRADWRDTLTVVAELHALGVDVDRSLLFSRGGYRCVALPTQPFTTERCWLDLPRPARLPTPVLAPAASAPLGRSSAPVPAVVSTLPVVPALASVPTSPVELALPARGNSEDALAEPPRAPENALLLGMEWHAVEAQFVDEAVDLSGNLVVLVNEETLDLAREALASLGNPQAFLVAGCGIGRSGPHALLDFDRYEAGVRLGEELIQRPGRLAGIIDLSDLRAAPRQEDEEEGSRFDSLGRIGLLQMLLKRSRGESFPLLHFTRGLRPFRASGPLDLGGGLMAALVSKLGAEYAGLRARTVDVEQLPESAEALASLLRQELEVHDPRGEVALRSGARYCLSMNPLTDTAGAAPLISADKTYVITGGVRGIGLEVAKHLVARGARRLALLGVRPLPPQHEWVGLLANPSTDESLCERLAPLQALLSQGVQVRVHVGSLTDAAALESFFGDVRATLGPIGGCVHSAGAVFFDPPSFSSKPLSQLRGVLEPKVDGLRVLERALRRDALDFFVLFSSVSGVAPSLAAGIVDYSAANAFMDLLSEHRRAQGRDAYQSIIWPNWKDVGMGEVGSAAYRALGLAAHSTSEGLALLDAALASKRAVVLPAIIEPARFAVDALLQPRVRPLPARLVRAESRVSPAVVQGSAAPVTRPALVVSPASVAAPASVTSSAPAAAPAPVAAPMPQGDSGDALREEVQQWLQQMLARVLSLSRDQVGADADFETLGLDSILLIEVMTKLEDWLGVDVDPSLPLQYRTVRTLVERLVAAYPEAIRAVCDAAHPEGGSSEGVTPEVRPQVPAQEAARPPEVPLPPRVPEPAVLAEPGALSGGVEPIAVVGMACHFPGSSGLEAYWRTLRDGLDHITEVPSSRWRAEDLYSSTHRPGRSVGKWGGFLQGIEHFDPGYFHIAKADAPCVDPLMRQFLEVSVQCLQHAGYARDELAGRRVGVFVGSRMSGYAARMPAPTRNGVIGSGQNFIAAHVSHFLDLKGPGLVVDTACSSSLVSLHLACQSLYSGESELALAGGVDILLDEGVYLTLSESRALSLDGRCKTFDERADGFVPGEGAGVVLLKPLRKALADGDRVYGVIDATAVNNDGHTMGITTPNPAGQRAVIEEALRRGRVNPRTLGYVEAHGTGTRLGDPIELKALTEVLAPAGARPGTCAVGSVKSNFGHLLSAAGIAGFLKVVLSLVHQQLPPTLHCATPNPRFSFESSPLFPNTVLRPWEPLEGVRRAGVSAFGFGGTNAHVLVSEAPVQSGPRREPRPPVVFSRERYWLEARGEAPAPRPASAPRPRRQLVALELGATG
nr:beta-ketoacyl synthase N-terminal-like domain-containing protein [Myxococcus sp. AM009]